MYNTIPDHDISAEELLPVAAAIAATDLGAGLDDAQVRQVILRSIDRAVALIDEAKTVAEAIAEQKSQQKSKASSTKA